MDATAQPLVRSIVLDLPNLLAATGARTIEELADLVDGDCDADIWLEETDDGVEIGAGIGAICLAYPFDVAEFWSTVDEVDGDEVRRWESMAEEDD
ncbi:hypothetical protein [Blastococcus sp. URHD0036]|uniref:hypothetical protein n=1 Tax=Blastococcus sp. URHD0036 TaxID=1380356 RepID=UPI000496CD6D|nr:hypothetical protein [Blastococcus sp. URHD0036]